MRSIPTLTAPTPATQALAAPTLATPTLAVPTLAAAIVVLGMGLVLSSPARAVDTPTASQIERALTGAAPASAPSGMDTSYNPSGNPSGTDTPIKKRGIRPGAGSADTGGGDPVSSWMRPGTPVGTSPRATPVAEQPREANLSVPFATGSAEVSASAARVLDQLGLALARPSLASGRFRIEGHTDTVGSADANRALSERRAAGVVEYLARRHGIDRTRLDPVGMGQERLMIPTGPGVAEARNRRVLVVNVGG